MSRVCQVTGAQPGFGQHISHSHVRSKRRFNVNVQQKRYWLPSENRHVRLTVSTRGITTVDVRGIEAVVARIRAKGGRV